MAVIIFSFFVLKYVYIYLSPFIIAAVLASLIDPPVNFIEKKLNIHRGFAVLFVLILVVTIMAILIILGISQAYVELNKLLQNLPDYNTIGNRLLWIINQNNRLEEFINNLDIAKSTKNMLNNNLQMLYDTVRNIIVDLINSVLTFLTKLPLILTILFLSFIATFFISRDKKLINNFIISLFPPEMKEKICKIRNELFTSAVGFIRAEIILISISGIIAGIGLAIIGNQYALIVGIGAAILDLIPIIGPGLIFVPSIIYSFLTANISGGFSLLIIYLIMSAVRSGAEGKIMGYNLGLHPLLVLIALYIGFRTMGALGFLVGPTLLIIIKAVAKADLIKLWE